MHSDPDWLRRCAAGEPAACRELVQQYGRMVGTIIMRTLGRADGVDDLAQETFLKVFRALPEFAGRAKFSTWICTIAQRVALDELRRRQRMPREVVADVQDEAVDATDTEADLAQAESDRIVRSALATLPDKYRLPLVYSTIDNLDYGTIASMLGMPVGTVKTHIFRGKQRLRELLAEHFVAERRHE